MYFTDDWFSEWAPIWESVVFKSIKKESWKCLEIGSYQGRSCVWVLENVPNLENITCVDTFEGSIENTEEQKKNLYEIFTGNIRGHEDKVIIKRGISRVVLKTIQDTYDFIYIDGSHQIQDVMTDCVLCFDLIRPNGVIIFDDYGYKGHPGVTTAVNAFLAVYGKYFRILYSGYQLVIMRNDLEV